MSKEKTITDMISRALNRSIKDEFTENICKQCGEPSYLGFSHCKKCHDYFRFVNPWTAQNQQERNEQRN